MATVVSSILPFPVISWWAVTLYADALLLDNAEHFEKMTSRNRYQIAGANGQLQLSIPIEGGRNNRALMKDIKIAPEKWQLQHWRTITSAYNRSPFFEHYAPDLQQMFERSFTYLLDFNLASIAFIQQQLKKNISFNLTEVYHPAYENAIDLRGIKNNAGDNFPNYYQVFSDRIGFLPNLSMLDLLFAEGPATLKWLEKNKAAIL